MILSGLGFSSRTLGRNVLWRGGKLDREDLIVSRLAWNFVLRGPTANGEFLRPTFDTNKDTIGFQQPSYGELQAAYKDVGHCAT